jgi:hypothetical protein
MTAIPPGIWEGDTLVLESAGFNDKTFLNATGAPHSDTVKTVERFAQSVGQPTRRCGHGPRSGHVHAGLEATVEGGRRPKGERESSAKKHADLVHPHRRRNWPPPGAPLPTSPNRPLPRLLTRDGNLWPLNTDFVASLRSGKQIK